MLLNWVNSHNKHTVFPLCHCTTVTTDVVESTVSERFLQPACAGGVMDDVTVRMAPHPVTERLHEVNVTHGTASKIGE